MRCRKCLTPSAMGCGLGRWSEPCCGADILTWLSSHGAAPPPCGTPDLIEGLEGQGPESLENITCLNRHPGQHVASHGNVAPVFVSMKTNLL